MVDNVAPDGREHMRRDFLVDCSWYCSLFVCVCVCVTRVLKNKTCNRKCYTSHLLARHLLIPTPDVLLAVVVHGVALSLGPADSDSSTRTSCTMRS